VTGYFGRYRFALFFLLGAAIAAGVALNWNWVTVARLLPILAFLPCMVMMFMCVKHGSRRPKPDEAAAPRTSPNPQ
jgi:peptidoglycan/LPS O-acetylase OafA/YrhL